MSNSSKLPLPASRLTHDSPPVKTRKALDTITTEMFNSPTFASQQKSSIVSKLPIKPPSLDLPKHRKTPKTGLPSRASHGNVDTRQRLRHIAQAAPTLDFNKRNVSNSKNNFMNDPSTLKRDGMMEERLMKLIGIEKDKLHELVKKINTTKEQTTESNTIKQSILSSNSEYKSQISDLEVQLINMEHRLIVAKETSTKSKIHEEQMYTLKLKEESNELVRDLDEFKSMMEQELQNAKNYKDPQIENDIAELESNIEKMIIEKDKLDVHNQALLKEEKTKLESQMNEIIRQEELKGDKLTDTFQLRNEEIDSLQSQLDSLNKEINIKLKSNHDLQLRLDQESDFQKSVHSTNDSLAEQILELTKENDQLDDELCLLTEEANEVDAAYQDSVSKFHREQKLRTRIENSIEDLNGKLRVYLKLSNESLNPKISNIDNQVEYKAISISGYDYKFNKIIRYQESTREICGIVENALKGCNVSILIPNNASSSPKSMIKDLCNTSTQILKESESKFKSYNFQTSYQFISISSHGINDLLNDHTSAQIKLENRQVSIDSHSISYENSSKLLIPSVPSNSSSLLKITINAQHESKSFISSIYIFQYHGFLETLKDCIDKIQQQKYQSTVFNDATPMHQLIHGLYANTKSLTLIHSVDEEFLKLGDFIGQVDSIPAKRMYSVTN